MSVQYLFSFLAKHDIVKPISHIIVFLQFFLLILGSYTINFNIDRNSSINIKTFNIFNISNVQSIIFLKSNTDL